MNFKTPISTTREQSERLLALGVKPETADMGYVRNYPIFLDEPVHEIPDKDKEDVCLSWSLARLLEMMPKYIDEKEEVLLMIEPPLVIYYDTRYKGQQHFTTNPDIFDNCIAMIDWLIRNGYFNKEYLINNEQ